MNTQSQSLNKLWKEILESIRLSVSTPTFNTWFSQTHLVSLRDDGQRYLAEIGCNSIFVRDTIENRYFSLIQELLSTALEKPCDIIFVIKQAEKKLITQTNSTPLFDETNQQRLIDKAKACGLRTNFTFKNFAVSSSNQMAHAAAEAVSKNLGNAYNPLFIWGGVGVGKTHLIHAVGNYCLEKKSDLNIFCGTGEKFTNDIVEGIRNRSTSLVRQKYRKLDALLIDDVQFIAGKEKVQEEFFHTFNDLVSSGSQIILTSDRPPSEMSKLEDRLRSRFEAGLIVDIAPPEFELRCAICEIKSKEMGYELDMDIIQLIAGNLETPRKIEGFLIKLFSEAKIKGKEITPEFVESLLTQGSEANGQTKIKANPKDIITAVSKYYSLGKRVLLGKSRARPIARPRQILMYLLRMELGLPLEQVGELIGRDHTTVMHAVDKITHLASSDVTTREDIRGIKNIL